LYKIVTFYDILVCPTLEGCWINLQYLALIAVAGSSFSEFEKSQRSCDVHSSHRNAVRQHAITARSERSQYFARLPVTFRTVSPAHSPRLLSLQLTNLTSGLLSIKLNFLVLLDASVHIVCPIKCNIKSSELGTVKTTPCV
jgi:hypothetical protein